MAEVGKYENGQIPGGLVSMLLNILHYFSTRLKRAFSAPNINKLFNHCKLIELLFIESS